MGDKELAYRCASAVNAYWAALGYVAGAEVAEVKKRHESEREIWEIKSALNNGLPPGCDGRRVPVLGVPKKRAEQ